MPVDSTLVRSFRCTMCGHKWIPRRPYASTLKKLARAGKHYDASTWKPALCARCKSPNWDVAVAPHTAYTGRS